MKISTNSKDETPEYDSRLAEKLSDVLVVCLSHFTWRDQELNQRPNQFMLRISKYCRVLYIHPYFFRQFLKKLVKPGECDFYINGNLYYYSAFYLPTFNSDNSIIRRINQRFMTFLIRRQIQRFKKGPVIAWYYFPEFGYLVGNLESQFMVWDIMDKYSEFWALDRQDIMRQEEIYLKNADIVFTGGWKLYEENKQFHPNITCFPCGVDVPHFNNAMIHNGALPEDILSISRPVLGFWASLDTRIDFPLLGFMARQRPDWSIVIIGPRWQEVSEMDEILALPNVHWLGAKKYETLPSYARAFDVCLIPFTISTLTSYMNPTKVLEYLATGKPVVSTALPDVVSGYSDHVYIGRSHDEMISMVESALSEEGDERKKKRLALAGNKTWEATVNEMLRKIVDAMEEKKIEL
jgi:glycosyltransferase involved in cell wall biosynthesis